ncbi:MAG: hypothetical protein B6U78_00935 [Candidatus Aenigmarchaeota archaeon ex4484_224]|nr:MAG: hypothetical protein B6U78_00935 [Candidatus Aenigmarchaeota archaeon ex4484_224]
MKLEEILKEIRNSKIYSTKDLNENFWTIDKEIDEKIVLERVKEFVKKCNVISIEKEIKVGSYLIKKEGEHFYLYFKKKEESLTGYLYLLGKEGYIKFGGLYKGGRIRPSNVKDIGEIVGIITRKKDRIEVWLNLNS